MEPEAKDALETCCGQMAFVVYPPLQKQFLNKKNTLAVFFLLLLLLDDVLIIVFFYFLGCAKSLSVEDDTLKQPLTVGESGEDLDFLRFGDKGAEVGARKNV